jgi:hypothetical protein
MDNRWYGTDGGNSTKDKVFLLSIEEVIKYFGDSGDLANRKGWYWNWEDSQDELRDGKGYYINDQHNSGRVAKSNNIGYWWWLRSPGYHQYDAAGVNDDGSIFLNGYHADYPSGGVRPALWLNL